MPLLNLEDEVPDFNSLTQKGPINFRDYCSGTWALFFAHPADFTPVCTTEFGTVAKLENEFKQRNCKIIGLSVDSVESHELWIRDINETQQVTVNFPIVADEDGEIAKKFAFANDFGKIVSRVLYLIDPHRRVKLCLQYPSNVGRNFYEVLRALDALQLGAAHPIGTPANWRAGEDVFILPELDNDSAVKEFPRGFTSIKPYLRITPAPDVEEVGEQKQF